MKGIYERVCAVSASRFLGMTGCACYAEPIRAAPGRITAHAYNSNFPLSHDAYNAIYAASDGKIYYVLSTESVDVGAQMFSFDPVTKTVERLGDLTEASGEKGMKAIPQGKSHVTFQEANGKLYFATHTGYYTIRDGMETMGTPPPGYKPYPGGHFLSFDLATHKFENYGDRARRRRHHHHEHGQDPRAALRNHMAYGILHPL